MITSTGNEKIKHARSLMQQRQGRELLLVLDGVRDPGNVGTLLRAALAAGVDEVLTISGSADPYNPKAVRAAMGAHFHLPLRADLGWDTIAAALAGLDVLLADAA